MTTNEFHGKRMPGGTLNAHAPAWKWIRIIGWSLAALIMLLPIVAMQFTTEVNWTSGDLLLAAILLGGTGLTFELMLRRSGHNAYRMAGAVALSGSLLLLWINAAVGFAGSGANTANVLYFAMIPMLITGSFAAGSRPGGMSRVMIAMAIVQALITVFAFVNGLVREDPVFMVVAINVFFILLWIGSALLFRKAVANEE